MPAGIAGWQIVYELKSDLLNSAEYLSYFP